MAFVVKDNVRETNTITGTGAVTTGGSISGWLAFGSVLNNGDTTWYEFRDNVASPPVWEVGVGTYTTSGTSIARTTVLASSNAGALVSFAGNACDCFMTLPAAQVLATVNNNALLFGTGADGAVTISSGTTTLTRDMHYTNLTINGTGVIRPNGFRVFVNGILDISAAQTGALIINGAAGPTATTSAAVFNLNPNFTTGNTVGQGAWGGFASGTGGATTGGIPAGSGGLIAGGMALSNGGAVLASGGGGSSGTPNLGGAGQTANYAGNGTSFQFNMPTININGMGQGSDVRVDIVGGGSGGCGGGGGGGDGTNSGGAGGAGGVGGGVMGIWAATIYRGTNTNSSIFQAKGGNGGTGAPGQGGTAGGGGGGAAGGGGFIYIVTAQLTGSTITNALDVSGGTGGTGGAGLSTGKGGAGGGGGNGGNTQVLILNPPTFTAGLFNQAGTAGSGTSTATGGAGGAGKIQQANL